jgi:hypothetical protein
MRDKKNKNTVDLEAFCFICSRPRFDFEQYALGFDHHRKVEHNHWSYLGFFIHVQANCKRNGTEAFIKRQPDKGLASFMPINRAMSLEQAPKENAEILTESAARDSRAALQQISVLAERMASVEQSSALGQQRMAMMEQSLGRRLEEHFAELTAVLTSRSPSPSAVARPRASQVSQP